MEELLKTTDPITISAATAYLKGEGIEAIVFDVHMSVLEGSLGILPRRLMVHEDDLIRARRIMALLDIETTPEDE
jgi:hypothetical protein